MADISRDEYDKIKMLLETNAKHAVIAKVVGRSQASVSRVASTMNYKDFNKRTGRVVKRQPKQPEQATLIQTVPTEDVFTRLQAMDAKIDKILGRLESRVETKKKRGWL